MTGQTAQGTDSLARIRAYFERTTHPDWRGASDTGWLLAEVDRLREENERLRALLTAALNTGAPIGTATEWGVRVDGHPVRDAVSEVRALADLRQMRTAHPDAHLVNRTTAYGPWQTADTQETAQ